MDPDTHILPHCGPTNGRLRLHLGLVIPEVMGRTNPRVRHVSSQPTCTRAGQRMFWPWKPHDVPAVRRSEA